MKPKYKEGNVVRVDSFNCILINVTKENAPKYRLYKLRLGLNLYRGYWYHLRDKTPLDLKHYGKYMGHINDYDHLPVVKENLNGLTLKQIQNLLD